MSRSPEDREIGRLQAEVEHLRERAERAERILDALREPSDAMRNKVCGAYFSSWDSRDIWTVVIHAAVAFAEQEVGP